MNKDLNTVENNTTVDGFFMVRDHYDDLNNRHITDLWWWLIDGDDFTVNINQRKLEAAAFDVFNGCNNHLKEYLLNHLDNYLIDWDRIGSGEAILTKNDLKNVINGVEF